MHGGDTERQDTLRITIQERPESTLLKLAGRVAGPWLAELRKAWRNLLPSLGSKVFAVDLEDVTFANLEGRRLLHDIHRETGCRFLANTPMTRDIAYQATHGTGRKEL